MTKLRSDVARQRLYEIMRREDDFPTKARAALDLGEEYLDVDNGHLVRVDRDTDYWEAIASSDGRDGEYPVGLVLELQQTYCRKTVAREGSVALHDAPEQGWADDPAFRTHDLCCYHGSTITVDDETYGTVCFVADDPREEPFRDDETLFAELVARMLERELSAARYEAELARRRELLQVVNRVLRHNLRNDMNVIRGQLRMLDEATEGLSCDIEAVVGTIDNLLELSETARELESVVRHDHEYRHTDLASLARSVAAQTEREFPEVTVDVAAPAELPFGAQPSIQSAIGELVDNSARYAGGEVQVRVAETERGARIRVTDDGPGLPPQDEGVLTEGVETPLVHGSGLGLWMVNWIVTDHGGEISVDTTDGTTVTVELPRAVVAGRGPDGPGETADDGSNAGDGAVERQPQWTDPDAE